MSCDDDTTTTEEVSVPTTLCNGDRVNNVWVEGAVDENGEGGICMLDTLSEAQIIYILQRDEKAREDLRRVTTNERLLELADTVPRLSTDRTGDGLSKGLNQGTVSPFYSTFRGRPPTAR